MATQYSTAKLINAMTDGQKAKCVSGDHVDKVIKRVGNSFRWEDDTQVAMEGILSDTWELAYITADPFIAFNELVNGNSIVLVQGTVETKYKLDSATLQVVITAEDGTQTKKPYSEKLFSFDDIQNGFWFTVAIDTFPAPPVIPSAPAPTAASVSPLTVTSASTGDDTLEEGDTVTIKFNTALKNDTNQATAAIQAEVDAEFGVDNATVTTTDNLSFVITVDPTKTVDTTGGITLTLVAGSVQNVNGVANASDITFGPINA